MEEELGAKYLVIRDGEIQEYDDIKEVIFNLVDDAEHGLTSIVYLRAFTLLGNEEDEEAQKDAQFRAELEALVKKYNIKD